MDNQGNDGGDCLPKFFKVYLPDESGDDLALPISYNKWLPKSLPKSVTVRSIYEKIWEMVLRKCIGDDTEKFVLVNGWKSIVKDEVLEGGEFLEFEFDGFSRFNFCIYGSDTCKRLRSSEQPIQIEDQSDGEDDKSSDVLTVLDDDDADDVKDDQNFGDKSLDNIIELDDDDDDDDDVEDHVEEDIEVLDDDDDDDDDVEDHVEEDIEVLDDDDDHTNDVHVEEDTISLTEGGGCTVHVDVAGVEDVPEQKAVCRICLEELEQDSEAFTMECNCKGNLALSHRRCAITWFSSKGNIICELCKTEVKNLRDVTLLRKRNARYQALARVSVLVIASMLAYYCFVVQLLHHKMKSYSFKAALPFGVILGLVSSVAALLMVKKNYVWIYAAIEFGLVALFTEIFYKVIKLEVTQPVKSIVLAALIGFGLTMTGTAAIKEYLRWRGTNTNQPI